MNSLDTILSDCPFFTRSEFPPDRLFYGLSAPFLLNVIHWRRECGVTLHPSRWVSDDEKRSGFCRYSGSPDSRHYAVGRKADAGDFFPDGDAMLAWLHAVRLFGGVGLYVDTRRSKLQPGPMIHVDNRAGSLWWARANGEYVYHHSHPARFWSIVRQAVTITMG